MAERRDDDAVSRAPLRGWSGPRARRRRVPSIVSVLTRTGRLDHHAVSLTGLPAGRRHASGGSSPCNSVVVLVAEVAQRAEDRVRARVWPRPQRLVCLTMSQSSSSSARSAAVALAWSRSAPAGRASARCRRGTECTCRTTRSMQNSMKNRATSTMLDGLVHDDHAARAHDRADLRERFVVDRRCRDARPGCSRRTGRRSAPP